MNLRVVIVDDNADFADSLAALVRLHGHTAHVAYDTASGYALARDVKPQVIFHDIELPDVDGFEAARRLRSDARFQDTTLVAITGRAEVGLLASIKAAGFDGLIPKAVAYPAIVDVLNGAIREATP